MKTQLEKTRIGGILGMVCGLAITLLLLSKNIIDIPRGTHEGGLMGAAIVAVVLAFMAVVIFVVAKLTKHRSQA
jgi:hypothetical protein